MIQAPEQLDQQALAENLGLQLKQSAKVLSVAESCTGGWLAATLVGVVGSSAWFDRGFVAYSYAAKCEMLGIPEEVLDTHGAVSAATVRAMALATLMRSNADVSIAISGVAGPGGGSPDKPVGLVWMAWAQKSGSVHAQPHHFSGDRNTIRRASVTTAIRAAIEHFA